MADQPDSSSQRPAAMSLAEAQRAVDAAILALGGYWPPLANLARLFEECGELARVVNQAHGPKRIKAGETQRALSDEIGDVLFVTLGLAKNLGVDAEEALRGALDRAAHRASPPGVAAPERPTPTAPADASAPTETDL